MKVVFRVDASIEIGTGHVMRCLTLADKLKANGAEITFVCRAHEGNLIELIRQREYAVHSLPTPGKQDKLENNEITHASWLGTDWRTDANQTIECLRAAKPDCLVVDHYALDKRWETLLRAYCSRLFVIDDLADRPHCCDLLLDQNLGRSASHYDKLIDNNSRCLIGPSFALLRPEFANLRPFSLQRRSGFALQRLLVSLGGMDKANLTGQVLQALNNAGKTDQYEVTVVMGGQSPNIAQVEALIPKLPYAATLLVNAQNMAQLMTEADLAIGAAGGTAWERCAMGLPSILLVMAENQLSGAKALAAAGAAAIARSPSEAAKMIEGIALAEMSESAARLCDGMGCDKVTQEIRSLCERSLHNSTS